MPLYEYRCDACGGTMEVLQRVSEAHLTTCPLCGGSLHKLASAPALQFKGTGWYVTDYAGHGRQKREALESSSASSSTPTTTESKPVESKPTESKPAASTPTTKAS